MAPPPNVTTRELGHRIAKERYRLRLTQRDLAVQASMSATTVNRIEQGHGANMDTVVHLLDHLGLRLVIEVAS